MRRYESYKDSCVEWLGEIPSHWECLPIRSIFKFRNEKNDPIKTDNILSLSIANGVTEYSDENRGGNKRKDDLSSYKLAYPNDIVLNSMNVIVGAVGVSKYFGAISPVYYALSLYNQRANLSYYESIFKNENFQRGLLRFGKGILIKFGENGKMNTIRMKISQDDLKKLYFPIPPLDEQQKIAQFLDDKTAKIDQAVDLAEKQIALLKEHKQILIQNAVTRGLNPDVPLKDSGVEWIGQVPEHWEVKKLKFVLTLSNKKEESKNSNKRYIGMENIESFTGKINDIPLIAEGIANSFYKDEILFGKLRPYLAKSYLADFDGICSTEFLVYRSTKVLNNRFALNIFLSYGFIDAVNASTYGSKMPRANAEFISNMFLAIPPLSEQKQIIDYLDKQTAKIDQAIALKTAHIEKLKEYKSVLINDVVTGKVRV
ncbi:MAG: restriction endonuclease subunit S [Haemophilus parainfluenzae]|uniref:restriction endonuclease subunit S n=1 Tax=Haemophilus sp. HMSC061E01 TaxID=1715211 RepID=UPI0008A623B1|nr:restriction endonuclease subunit S [Haemophilus sp. HMSC061E01]MBS5558674.1 restriction endonuclease subunit S [Haemophilus parainfluenzae]MBS6683719.1 restriction endonuclease subunit S [Haemophilus parainfluenzae]OFL93783.1 restriction endonuclease subunit S [Haemophilus sp. HMSC061E01]